eukprot:1159391-Pelagomonas_calceolata.AAC.1
MACTLFVLTVNIIHIKEAAFKTEPKERNTTANLNWNRANKFNAGLGCKEGPTDRNAFHAFMHQVQSLDFLLPAYI